MTFARTNQELGSEVTIYIKAVGLLGHDCTCKEVRYVIAPTDNTITYCLRSSPIQYPLHYYWDQ